MQDTHVLHINMQDTHVLHINMQDCPRRVCWHDEILRVIFTLQFFYDIPILNDIMSCPCCMTLFHIHAP